VPSFGAYRGATTQGQDAFKLWQGFFIAGLVVWAIVMALIIWAIVKFRRRTDDVPKQTQYHTAFEIMYTVAPIIMVLILFVFVVVTENKVDATPTDHQLTVTVKAFQWGWEFDYDNAGIYVRGVETQDPAMVIPYGETVEIHLESLDVIHGFYIPEFNFSRYAQPGVVNTFDFNVLHPGTYRGQCTQLCGLYHSLMFFQVKAVSPQQFQTWVHQKQVQASVASYVQQHQVAKGGV